MRIIFILGENANEKEKYLIFTPALVVAFPLEITSTKVVGNENFNKAKSP